MSHQIILTFDMDENKIRENAEIEAARQIAKRVMADMTSGYYTAEIAARDIVKTAVREMLEEKKDEIIKEAVHEVVGNLHRTKAVKEMLEREEA